jgi:hypothetical protein
MKLIDIILGKYVLISKEELLMLSMDLRSYKGLFEQHNAKLACEINQKNKWVQMYTDACTQYARLQREFDEYKKAKEPEHG